FAEVVRIASGAFFGAIGAVAPVDRAAKRRGGEVYVVVAGVHFAGYCSCRSAELSGKIAARCGGIAAAVGFHADYAERGNCRSGGQARVRERRYRDGLDQPRGTLD